MADLGVMERWWWWCLGSFSPFKDRLMAWSLINITHHTDSTHTRGGGGGKGLTFIAVGGSGEGKKRKTDKTFFGAVLAVRD